MNILNCFIPVLSKILNEIDKKNAGMELEYNKNICYAIS